MTNDSLTICMTKGCPTIPLDRVLASAPKAVLVEEIREAEVVFGWPALDVLPEAKRLRWLHLPSAGADRYVQRDLFARRDIRLTASNGVYGMPIAEHILAMILAFNRSLPDHVRGSRDGEWTNPPQVRDFFGSTVGVLGLGDIGSELAKRAHALGARVLAVKRTPVDPPSYVEKLYKENEIDAFLSVCDYLVLALPSTANTQGLLSRERIAQLPPHAFVVNVGRGSAIDQDALIEALKDGRLAGAGLDVTTPEPLPPDHPLWTLPNVLITSHTSGRSPTNDGRSARIFLDNLRRYVLDEALENLVDFDAGY